MGTPKPLFKADLTPPHFDAVLYDNEPTAFSFTIKDKITEAVVDVSDGIWESQYRIYELAEDFISITVDTTDAATGLVVAHFTEANVADFELRGVWDIQFTPTGGSIDTIAKARIFVERDVTRT